MDKNSLVRQYARGLHDALHEVRPEDQDKVLDNFVAVLKSQNHLDLMLEIEEEFLKILPASGVEANVSAIEHFNDIVKNDPELSKIAKTVKAIVISDDKPDK